MRAASEICKMLVSEKYGLMHARIKFFRSVVNCLCLRIKQEHIFNVRKKYDNFSRTDYDNIEISEKKRSRRV